jgi:hypothetical protein
VEGVFFERGAKAGACRWGHARLTPVEAFAEQLVRVGPVEITNFVLDVLTLALVVSTADDLPENWVLHHDARESAHVRRRRLIVFVAEAVGVGVVRGLEAESTPIPIHFLKEVLHGLVALEATLVLVEGTTRARVDASRRILLLVALVILGVGALLAIFEARGCFE